MHFPSSEEIVYYLEHHPLTSDPYLKEKGIIEATARSFANRDLVPRGIQMGVLLTMLDLNHKINLPQAALIVIKLNLTSALRDCAAATQIEISKSKI